MTTLHTAQGLLFGASDLLPEGLAYVADFVDPEQERALLELASALPVREARFKEYTARRRVYAYGSRLDRDEYQLRPAAIGELPECLARLRSQLADWAGVATNDFVHVMISEYRPGAPLGWHRDAPVYEVIVGVSLGGPARMRWRPWEPSATNRSTAIALDLAPRSAYIMRGPARWGWQHSVSPVPALRYSITMRTARGPVD